MCLDISSNFYHFLSFQQRVGIMMLKGGIMFHLMLIMIMEGVLMKAVMGNVYNVGDSQGWTILDKSNYATWASLKKFRVGDTLLFHYNRINHNVVQVNWRGFRSCNITRPLKRYETGNDTFIIKAPGHYFFICTFPGHCEGGQKLDVRVLKRYSLTNVSSSTGTPTAGPPKTSKMAPRSVANVATDHDYLFRCIVVVSTIYIAMWVA